MAYTGLKTLVDARAGRQPLKRIDLPPTLVTHENQSDPKIQQLIDLDIKKYLR